MKKYLIIQAARFGDFLQTRRLIVSLQKFGEIYLLIDVSLVELARRLYPKAHVFGITFHKRPNKKEWQANMQMFTMLAAISFTKIYNCNFSPLTNIICRLFNEYNIIGYRPARCPKEAILKSPWARLAFRTILNRAIATLNLEDFWAWFFSTPIPAEEVNPIAQGHGGGIGVVISGREERRSVPANLLAELISLLYKLSGCKIIKFFGTTNEQHKAYQVKHLLSADLKDKVIDFTGKTSLLELNEEICGLDLLITPDTGIMHLGALHGVPVMAFFLSSANSHETGPYGKGHFIYQSVTPCSPCLETSRCPKNHQCFNPFKNQELLKFISKTYFYHQETLPEIEGLQCWTTSFDNLGQKLILVGGEDRHFLARSTLRILLKDFLGLTNDNISHSLPYEKEIELIELCFPDIEWMLPRERYI